MWHRVRRQARRLRADLRQVFQALAQLLGRDFLQGTALLPAKALFRNNGIHWNIMRLGKDRVHLAQFKANPNA